MSRARTQLRVITHQDCDGKRRERKVEWEARGKGDVETVLDKRRIERDLLMPGVS